MKIVIEKKNEREEFPENVHKKAKKLFEKIDEVDGGIYK